MRNNIDICNCCEYLTCISNNSPCYTCRHNSQFSWDKEYIEIIEPAPCKHHIQHKIVKGETLTKIASQYKTTVGRLAYANKIVDVNYIREGDMLTIY